MRLPTCGQASFKLIVQHLRTPGVGAKVRCPSRDRFTFSLKILNLYWYSLPFRGGTTFLAELCATLARNLSLGRTHDRIQLVFRSHMHVCLYCGHVLQRLGRLMYYWQSRTMISCPVRYERRCSKHWLGLSVAPVLGSICISASSMTGSQHYQKISVDELQLRGCEIIFWTHFSNPNSAITPR